MKLSNIVVIWNFGICLYLLFVVLGILVGTNHWGSPVFSVYETIQANPESKISPRQLGFAIETAVLAFSKLGLAVKLMLVAALTIFFNSILVYHYSKKSSENQNT